MIEQVLADTRQIVHDLDAKFTQDRSRTDAPRSPLCNPDVLVTWLPAPICGRHFGARLAHPARATSVPSTTTADRDRKGPLI